MSLLFRCVWRRVLHVGSFSSTALRSPSLSSCISEPLSPVSEVKRSRTPDVIMASIKSAPNMTEVLQAVQAHLPTMTHKHMLQALRCIFELHKQAGSFDNDAENVIKDPAFMTLCQNFKKHARALDVHEAIEATKVLSYLGVPVNSLIVQTMLQLIRCNINALNIRQVMFLDFVISRFDKKNHLVDALKLALPLVFQIHLPIELDKQDLPLLKDMLSYCCSHELPDRCINNIVTALLLHDQIIDGHTAKSIIWSLCQVNCTDNVYPTRVQLLHICYDILTQSINQLSYDEVLRTAAKIKGRVLEKHPEYYHELLMDAIAHYVVEHNIEFEKALLVARVLSRISHTHLRLVEYLCELAASDPTSLSNARTNILFGFVNCLSNNNYTPNPEQWNELRKHISKNPVLNSKSAALPWAKFCLELASLGHFEDKLITRVFSKEFLDEYLSRENNTLDYLQLLTLHEAVTVLYNPDYMLPEDVLEKAKEMYPTHALTEQLEEYLSRGIGGSEYVARNVVLPNGVISDLLLCLKNGYPVQMPASLPRDSHTKVPLKDLKLPATGVVVCIMNFNQGCFSMNSNRLRGTFRLILDILEKRGYAALAININEWQSAPPHERAPYLMREINFKCGEIGMKLTAT